MKSNRNCVLTINGGSSSIKFALYEIERSLKQLFYGKMENIGTKNTQLSFTNADTHEENSFDINAADHTNAGNLLIEWLEKKDGFVSVKAIGHRIVHGMKHTDPQQVTSELLDELKKISAYDPEHLPGEINLIELFQKRYRLAMLFFDSCHPTFLIAELRTANFPWWAAPSPFFDLLFQRPLLVLQCRLVLINNHTRCI